MKKTIARSASLVLSLALLCGLFSAAFSVSALTLGKVVDFEGYENGANLVTEGVFAYAADGVTITADTSVHADGKAGAKLDAAAHVNWKSTVMPVAAGSFDGASALIFYLKTPAAQAEAKNFNFTITLEHADSGYSYTADATVKTLAKGAAAWTDTTYWNDFGPNIPYGFEGFVKLPLDTLGVKWTNTDETTVDLSKVTQITAYWCEFGGETGPFYVDAFCAVQGPDDGSTNIDGLLNPTAPETSTSNGTSTTDSTTASSSATTGTSSTSAEETNNIDVLCDYEGYEVGDTLKRDDDNPSGLIQFPDKGVAMDLHAQASDVVAADGRLSMQVSADIKQDWAQGFLYLPEGTSFAPYSAVILYVKAPDTGKEEEFSFSIAACVSGGDYRLPDCEVQLLRRGSSKWETADYFDNFGVNMGTGFEGYIKFYLKDFIRSYGDVPETLNPANLEFFSMWFHNFGGFSDVEGADTSFYFDALYGVREDDGDVSFVPDGWGEGEPSQPTAPTSGTTEWQGDPDPEATGSQTEGKTTPTAMDPVDPTAPIPGVDTGEASFLWAALGTLALAGVVLAICLRMKREQQT